VIHIHSVVRVLVPQIAHEGMASGIPTSEVTAGELHDSSRR
jgi:hypothetical protein